MIVSLRSIKKEGLVANFVPGLTMTDNPKNLTLVFLGGWSG
jgi:hypothetical protein